LTSFKRRQHREKEEVCFRDDLDYGPESGLFANPRPERRLGRTAKKCKAPGLEAGYHHGRPNEVIDHIVPLKRGGADFPPNMQWQTKDAAKAKDKWE
jgi:hypothetical protein